MEVTTSKTEVTQTDSIDIIQRIVNYERERAHMIEQIQKLTDSNEELNNKINKMKQSKDNFMYQLKTFMNSDDFKEDVLKKMTKDDLKTIIKVMSQGVELRYLEYKEEDKNE